MLGKATFYLINALQWNKETLILWMGEYLEMNPFARSKSLTNLYLPSLS